MRNEFGAFYSYNSGTPQCATYLFLHPEFDPAEIDAPILFGSYCALDGTPITGPEQANAELAFGPVVRDSGWALRTNSKQGLNKSKFNPSKKTATEARTGGTQDARR